MVDELQWMSTNFTSKYKNVLCYNKKQTTVHFKKIGVKYMPYGHPFEKYLKNKKKNRYAVGTWL
jgi:hypothetical protein